MAAYETLPSRSRRMCFLRKILQDNLGELDEDLEETQAGGQQESRPAPLPPSLAMMMNTTRIIQHAPGISQRRKTVGPASLQTEKTVSVGKFKSTS